MLPPPPKQDATLDEWLHYFDELRNLPSSTPYLEETIEFGEGIIERMANPPKG